MTRRVLYGLVIMLGIIASPRDGFAWEYDEHRLLADSAYAVAMRLLGTDIAPGGGAPSSGRFGEWCADGARDDMSPSRFHRPGRTTLDQLGQISAAELGAFIDSHFFKNRNVIVSYLQYHVAALHAACLDVPEGQALRRALMLEAEAQGYLADAFSSGHMLVPIHSPLSQLTPRNNLEAHKSYSHQGVYVINARGQVWQAFGDGMLFGYLPSYRAVLNACETSLKEIVLTWYHACKKDLPPALQNWADSVRGGTAVSDMVAAWLDICNGKEYLEKVRMPSLMLLPMPVPASWSIRTDEKDQHGVREHFHYPQLREDGFHDPDLSDIDRAFLYPRSSVPDWMIPRELLEESADPKSLIRDDPDWASVRWVQQRSMPPSFHRLLVRPGMAVAFSSEKTRAVATMGLDYGLCDDLLLLKNVSMGLSVMPSPPREGGPYIIPAVGVGLPIWSWTRLKAVHLGAGPAMGLAESRVDFGAMLGVGFDSHVLNPHLGNFGITIRAEYRWLIVDRFVHGPVLEMILQ
jgi:hypothetical protein